MKVYYNKSCSICRAEINLYKKQNIEEIDWVDITNNVAAENETLKDNIKEIDTKHIGVDWKNFELKSEPGVKRSGVIAQELEASNMNGLVKKENLCLIYSPKATPK